MIVSDILSAFFYIGTIWILPYYLQVCDLNDEFFFWVFVIVIINWAPIFMVKFIMKRRDPSDFQKIMKHVKR